MKKIYLLSLLLLSTMLAKANVVFSIVDAKVKVGTNGTVQVNLENDEDLRGFELKIYLPEGVSLRGAKVQKDNTRLPTTVTVIEDDEEVEYAGFTITGNNQSDGSYKISVSSTSGQKIKAGSGAIFKILVKAAENAALSEKEIRLNTIRYSKEVNGTPTLFNVDDVTGKIVVYTTFNVTATPNKETAGSITGAGEYENGTNATLTATSNEGYSFTKWSNDVTENPYTFAVNAATTLTAEFTPITYTIGYNLTGGTLADGVTNADSYTVESDDIKLNNPTRKGYTFVGWTGTGLTEATKEVTIAKGSTENRSYTATWTPITYTIGYELAGGTVATANPES